MIRVWVVKDDWRHQLDPWEQIPNPDQWLIDGELSLAIVNGNIISVVDAHGTTWISFFRDGIVPTSPLQESDPVHTYMLWEIHG